MTTAPWNREVRGSQVLELINGDHAVLRVPAGPGTGKTFGLRRRVLRILHPDGLAANPRRVLVSTFNRVIAEELRREISCLLYTSPSPRDRQKSRMPSSA